MNRKEQKEKSMNMTAKGLKKQFPDTSKKNIKWIMKNSRKLVGMYNNFCPDCKRLVMQNPKRNPDDYCDKCREKAKEVIEK